MTISEQSYYEFLKPGKDLRLWNKSGKNIRFRNFWVLLCDHCGQHKENPHLYWFLSLNPWKRERIEPSNINLSDFNFYRDLRQKGVDRKSAQQVKDLESAILLVMSSHLSAVLDNSQWKQINFYNLTNAWLWSVQFFYEIQFPFIFGIRSVDQSIALINSYILNDPKPNLFLGL